MQYLKLIGILIIVLGFIFKLNIIFTVIFSGFVTAMVAGLSVTEFLTILGQSFTDQRIVTLFIITLPVIGLSEEHGLKQVAEDMVKKRENMSPGALLSVYLAFRELAAFLSMRIYGLVQFVRPIIYPMAKASAEKKYGALDEKEDENLKARAASMENFGNFFAQNTFVGAGGVLLMVGTMAELGYDISNITLAQYSIPVAIITLVVGVVRNIIKDKKMTGGKSDV